MWIWLALAAILLALGFGFGWGYALAYAGGVVLAAVLLTTGSEASLAAALKRSGMVAIEKEGQRYFVAIGEAAAQAFGNEREEP